MNRITGAVRVALMVLTMSFGLLVEPAAAACASDSVQSGTVCIDKYEASVWYVPSTQRGLILNIQRGTATLTTLTNAGAIQLGLTPGDLAANGCPDTGNGCVNVYAASIPGVTPAAFINWFQAAAAARNSLKRLPTNQEWQAAALGTQDPGGADDGTTTCNTFNLASGRTATGSRSDCVSDIGAFDMVGNVSELVAEWLDLANNCTATFGNDLSCVGGPGSDYSNLPGALHRGGRYNIGTSSGVFMADATGTPSDFHPGVGFRCAR